MESERATAAQVHSPGGVEQGRDLSEPIAAPPRRDCRQLGSHVLGKWRVTQSSTPSSRRRRRFSSTPALP